MEALVVGNSCHLHLQHIVVLPRHKMTRSHAITAPDPRIEGVECRCRLSFQSYPDEHRDVDSQSFAINECLIARDNPIFLKSLNTSRYCRRRKTYSISNLFIGSTATMLQ